MLTNCPDPDCPAVIGQPHEPGCPVAVCLTTGQQRIQHLLDDNLPDGHQCGADVWTGHIRGADTAAALGWWAYRIHGIPGASWMPCPPGTPGAVPDLNRVVRQCTWSPADRTWRYAPSDEAALGG